MIDWQKINVVAAPILGRIDYVFFFPFSSLFFFSAFSSDRYMYMRIKSLCILYQFSSGPAFVSWRLDAALRLGEIYK